MSNERGILCQLKGWVFNSQTKAGNSSKVPIALEYSQTNGSQIINGSTPSRWASIIFELALIVLLIKI